MSEGLEALTRLVKVVMSYRPPDAKGAKASHVVKRASKPTPSRTVGQK